MEEIEFAKLDTEKVSQCCLNVARSKRKLGLSYNYHMCIILVIIACSSHRKHYVTWPCLSRVAIVINVWYYVSLKEHMV